MRGPESSAEMGRPKHRRYYVKYKAIMSPTAYHYTGLFGKCMVCQKEVRGTHVICIKRMGVVCYSHDAYVVLKNYDDGEFIWQKVVGVFATREEAEACAKQNARASDSRSISYSVMPLHELVGLQPKFKVAYKRII
jgi:uncharacterized protein YfcZ (UPF0381/DUF406 family)